MVIKQLDELTLFSVGGKFPAIKDFGEGVLLDWLDSGPMLIYNFNRPSQAEIASVEAQQPYEFRFARVNGILFFLAKLGSLEWADAPFAFKLSGLQALPEAPDPGMGFALTIAMVDSATNTLQALRMIGLGHDFSMALRSELEHDFSVDFDAFSYDAKLQETYRQYRTKDLVQFSQIRCKG